MQEQYDLLSNDLLINDLTKANLNSTAKWGKFLAITGFVFFGFMIIGGIAIQVVTPSLNSYGYNTPYLQYLGIVYIVSGAIMFVPCILLLKFSNKILNAIISSNQENLDAAFVNLKSMFKFYGILTIVILVICAVSFLVGIAGAMR